MCVGTPGDLGRLGGVRLVADTSSYRPSLLNLNELKEAAV